MNELMNREMTLPDTLTDLTKFVLVGREKLVSVRAEIRAIEKVELAQEVRDQKRQEAQMLSEALLDAEVRLGDLLKQIPKRAGGDRRSVDFKTDNTVYFEKPKKEVIKELGFSEKQAQRFETLADNKDLVEQVKREARENDDLPTRTRVIDLAQQRRKREEEEKRRNDDFCAYIDECKLLSDKYHKAIGSFMWIRADEKEFQMLREIMLPIAAETYLRETEEAIAKLTRIRNFMKGVIDK